jgi:hypothetical protein
MPRWRDSRDRLRAKARSSLRYRGVSEDTHESKGSVRFTVSAKGTEKPMPVPPEGHGHPHKD